MLPLAAKTVKPGFARWKCTPSAYGTSPGGGGLLSAFLSANLCRSFYSAARISPSGGDAAAGGRRGAFPLARKGGLPVFHRAKPGCKGFIHTGGGAAHHSPLNPLHPLHLLNPHARQGVSLTFSYKTAAAPLRRPLFFLSRPLPRCHRFSRFPFLPGPWRRRL